MARLRTPGVPGWWRAPTPSTGRSGSLIGRFAQVRETLADAADAEACLAAITLLAGLQEAIDQSSASDTDRLLPGGGQPQQASHRSAAHDMANRGIEVLGGNGAIESFSVLPRLLRDNVVYENWEGATTYCGVVFSDRGRYGVHAGFFAYLRDRSAMKPHWRRMPRLWRRFCRRLATSPNYASGGWRTGWPRVMLATTPCRPMVDGAGPPGGISPTFLSMMPTLRWWTACRGRPPTDDGRNGGTARTRWGPSSDAARALMRSGSDAGGGPHWSH